MAWLGTKVFDSKSKYNSRDLNRVNENIEFLLSELKAFGYDLSLETEKGYTMYSFPTVSAINKARENILELINAYPPASEKYRSTGSYIPFRLGSTVMVYGTPESPLIELISNRRQVFDFNEANKLELNLRLIYELVSEERNKYKICGTFYSGEDGVLYGV